MLAGKPLPDSVLSKTVLGTTGKSVVLRDLILTRDDDARSNNSHEAPTLLVFVRQFACAGCSERMTELLISLEILHSSGVNVIVVGCGSVEHAKALQDRFALETRPITVVTDPSVELHQAAGLLRTVWGTVGAKATWNLVRMMSKGHKNGWSQGDFYQLGGTILLDANGDVVLHHEEKHLGETFPIADVVERALALLARSALNGADVP